MGSELLSIDLPLMGKAKPRRSFITSACSRTSLGYSDAQRCLAPVPRASLPFATVNFKDGEKDHEISKSQYIFSFIFPKEMDMDRLVWLCSLRLQAKKGTWRKPLLYLTGQASLDYPPLLLPHPSSPPVYCLTSRASLGSPAT